MHLRDRVFLHLLSIIGAVGLTLVAACGAGDPPSGTGNDNSALVAAAGPTDLAGAVQTGRGVLLNEAAGSSTQLVT